MPLEDLNPELLRYISEYLSGRDLVAFSRTSKAILSLLSERYWQRAFDRDFGFQGLQARTVLSSHGHQPSWRAAYTLCMERQIYIWGTGVAAMDPQEPSSDQQEHLKRVSYQDIFEPRRFELPPDIIPRDIGLTQLVNVLTTDGHIRRFSAKLSTEQTLGVEYESRNKREPGPCTEMTTTTSELIAVDALGIWWMQDNSRWSNVLPGKSVWPGTLTTAAGYGVALSKCGQYIYIVDCNRRLQRKPRFRYRTAVVALPQLLSIAPLKSVKLVANKDMPDYLERQELLVCVQVDSCCHVIVMCPHKLSILKRVPADIESDIVSVRLLGDRSLLTVRDDFGFQIVCANGDVVRGQFDPSNSEQPTIEIIRGNSADSPVDVRWFIPASHDDLTWRDFRDPDPGFNLMLSSTGKLVGRGRIRDSRKPLMGRGSSEPEVSANYDVKTPSVMRLDSNSWAVAALCLTSSHG